MTHWLPTVCILLALGAEPIETRFVQVAPTATDGAIARSAGQGRAVVLIE